MLIVVLMSDLFCRYVPPAGAPRPPAWPPQPPTNQGWTSMSGHSVASRPPQPPQPLFPIQNVRPLPLSSSPAAPGVPQPLFPIRPPSTTLSASQPLFPLGTPTNGLHSSPLSPGPPPPGAASPLSTRPPGDEGQPSVGNLVSGLSMSSARLPAPHPYMGKFMCFSGQYLWCKLLWPWNLQFKL